MFMKLITPIVLRKGQAVVSLTDPAVFGDGDAVTLAQNYSNTGSDILLIFDQSEGDEEHDLSLTLMRQMARLSDIPMWGAGNVKRVEDVKKILYAGCKKAVLNYSKPSNMEMLEEVSKRFGREKIAVCVKSAEAESVPESRFEKIVQYARDMVILANDMADAKCAVDVISKKVKDTSDLGLNVIVESADSPFVRNGQEITGICEGLHVDGIGGAFTQDLEAGLMEMKAVLKSNGYDVNLFESEYSWDDLKVGPDDLIPVVVQDYRNEEVLMVAYMNREAYEQTIRTGVMTYWSRSRSELWVKGLTSGHYQYLKELRIDCDNDTLLARVSQIGAACHTGNRSCFYRTALKKDTPQRNPMKVFEDVYATIEDRRIHPKEGSYTNYLFAKGIDKILKKCGEEATEIVIAAKNPNPEEVKYEMADFLYHMMVLMSERGITWDDIAQELANRE